MDPQLIKLFNEGNLTPQTLKSLGWSGPKIENNQDIWTYPNGNTIKTNAYGYGVWTSASGNETADVQINISGRGKSSTSASAGGSSPDPQPQTTARVADDKHTTEHYTYSAWSVMPNKESATRKVYENGKEVGIESAIGTDKGWKMINAIGPNTTTPDVKSAQQLAAASSSSTQGDNYNYGAWNVSPNKESANRTVYENGKYVGVENAIGTAGSWHLINPIGSNKVMPQAEPAQQGTAAEKPIASKNNSAGFGTDSSATPPAHTTAPEKPAGEKQNTGGFGTDNPPAIHPTPTTPTSTHEPATSPIADTHPAHPDAPKPAASVPAGPLPNADTTTMVSDHGQWTASASHETPASHPANPAVNVGFTDTSSSAQAAHTPPATHETVTSTPITPVQPKPAWTVQTPPAGGVDPSPNQKVDLSAHGTTLASRDSVDGTKEILQMSDGTYQAVNKTTDVVTSAGTWGDGHGGGIAQNGVGNSTIPQSTLPTVAPTTPQDIAKAASAPPAHGGPAFVIPPSSHNEVSVTGGLGGLDPTSNIHHPGKQL